MQTLGAGRRCTRHNDDQGHLINRGGDPDNLANYTESPLADWARPNFLDWFPPCDANAGRRRRRPGARARRRS